MTLETFKSEVVVHYASMYRIALALTRQSEEAADAVQESMCRLWNHRTTLDNVTDLRAYCLSTVRNECLCRLRRINLIDRIRDVNTDDLTVEGDDTLPDVRDELSRVRTSIRLLPPLHRRVLEMSAFGGCSTREISEVTGLGEVNVRVILSRTRKHLRTLFSR